MIVIFVEYLKLVVSKECQNSDGLKLSQGVEYYIIFNSSPPSSSVD